MNTHHKLWENYSIFYILTQVSCLRNACSCFRKTFVDVSFFRWHDYILLMLLCFVCCTLSIDWRALATYSNCVMRSMGFHRARLMGFNYNAIYSIYARHILFCCLQMKKFLLFEMTRSFTVHVALCLDVLKLNWARCVRFFSLGFDCKDYQPTALSSAANIWLEFASVELFDGSFVFNLHWWLWVDATVRAVACLSIYIQYANFMSCECRYTVRVQISIIREIFCVNKLRASVRELTHIDKEYVCALADCRGMWPKNRTRNGNIFEGNSFFRKEKFYFKDVCFSPQFVCPWITNQQSHAQTRDDFVIGIFLLSNSNFILRASSQYNIHTSYVCVNERRSHGMCSNCRDIVVIFSIWISFMRTVASHPYPRYFYFFDIFLVSPFAFHPRLTLPLDWIPCYNRYFSIAQCSFCALYISIVFMEIIYVCVCATVDSKYEFRRIEKEKYFIKICRCNMFL